MRNRKQIEKEKDDVIFVQLDVVQLPEFSIDKSEGIIKWGKKNDFPVDAIKLYKTNPIHQAIVKGKARYLSGLSLKPEKDLPIVQDFLKRANKKESWYQLKKKCDNEKALWGGFAILVTTNIAGQPLEWKHVDFGKIRICESLQGCWVSDEWSESKYKKEKTWFPFYRDGYVGESILIYKDHSPSVNKKDDVYPKPEYESVILDISTFSEISKFYHSLVKNGFSPGHIITFFSGKVKPEVKEDIQRRFQGSYTGPEGLKTMINFESAEGKGVEVAKLDTNNLDKQYQELSAQLRDNIISGHNVPGVLFKIKKEGAQLGNDRNELDIAYELFIKEYAMPEQEPFNTLIQKFCLMKTGVDTKFSVEQLPPLKKDLPLDNEVIKQTLDAIDPRIFPQYVIDYFGIKLPEGAKLPASQPVQPAQMDQTQVNESIKNLTGRQRQGLDAVLRKFSNGTYNRDQAIMHLKAFGFTEADAIKYLGVQMSVVLGAIQLSDDEKRELFLTWLKDHTVEIDPNDELISVEEIDFKNRDEAIRFELSNQIKVKLDKEDFKKESPGFKDFLRGLVSRKPSAPKSDEYDTEVYTVYRYALKAGVTGPILIPTSHQFCIDMVEATSGNKRLTFDQIDSYTNDFGDNAWDFRGGWWGKKQTCRHIWLGETRIRKVKK